MQQLPTTKRVLVLLCMCSADGCFSKWEKSGRISFAFVIFALNLCFFGVHVASAIGFLPINYEDSLYAFIGAVGIFGVIYTMIAAFYLRHQISAIFLNLSEINKKCKFVIQLIKGKRAEIFSNLR